METLVWVVHIIAALGTIGLVLMQHGKGADMGAAFGSGASGSLFGSSGSANFLSRATAVFATIFFLTSLTLTYFSSHRNKTTGLMESHSVMQPAVPADAAKQVVPVVPAPAGVDGSKSGEIPK
ncbi:preprotein translocase subunit SecG [Sulfuricella denitrificans skB26]|uniref:Protein-export membrane protein SecG n=1 Tax=Sulfuricella denitrificans (strain DSM 22764 / NBRC 105220 / skB26) TaxID=1163617 RepID=S6ABK2_SULDS|nr:preprotein translocase subunit SecG [Sulfuricella denitrificans]BAN34778.1 preprotein translocase subunit SecG [Sulfuricella denitrificans skB26]